jgi:hypothetical protein
MIHCSSPKQRAGSGGLQTTYEPPNMSLALASFVGRHRPSLSAIGGKGDEGLSHLAQRSLS